MQIEQRLGVKVEKIGIGFEIYDLGGKRVQGRRVPAPKFECNGGYQVAREVSLEAKIPPNSNGYTVLITTFEPRNESKFNFMVWHKKTGGRIDLMEA